MTRPTEQARLRRHVLVATLAMTTLSGAVSASRAAAAARHQPPHAERIAVRTATPPIHHPLTPSRAHRLTSHRLFASTRIPVDRMLARPYDSEVPFGASGDTLWATSPQGWAFREGVNYLYYTNSNVFDLAVTAGGVPYDVGKAWYTPSHVHMAGAPDYGGHMSASASFTYTIDGEDRPLTKPFRREKRWTCWSSGRREDWYAVRLGGPRIVTGVDLYFYDDQPVGGCAPPESVRVEARSGATWRPVEIAPLAPKPDRNAIAFRMPERAEELRFTFRHRGADKYTGLYGVDPRMTVPPDALRAATHSAPLNVEGDKWISEDDVLVSRISVINTTARPQHVTVTMESPLATAGQGVDGETRISGFRVFLRGGGDSVTNGRSFAGVLRPRERRSFTFAVAANASAERADSALARVLADPDPVRTQERAYQGWFDANTAGFLCNDPAVTKMYYHRWYNVKKNSMNPRLGRLQHRAFAEGRWTADWYANVISYGAGHQIR
ncbi:MAG TPA: hypothetical protein VKT77_10675, partial [Chthonomonadaceae bacterium]|nr:hypothetical protein [Chthonomonadaceae bacterium]